MKDDARHEFRFVVQGLDLDAEQVATIENAIREAALLAMSRASIEDAGFVTINPRAVFDRLKWRGIWLLSERVAKDSLRQVADQNAKSIR